MLASYHRSLYRSLVLPSGSLGFFAGDSEGPSSAGLFVLPFVSGTLPCGLAVALCPSLLFDFVPVPGFFVPVPGFFAPVGVIFGLLSGALPGVFLGRAASPGSCTNWLAAGSPGGPFGPMILAVLFFALVRFRVGRCSFLCAKNIQSEEIGKRQMASASVIIFSPL